MTDSSKLDAFRLSMANDIYKEAADRRREKKAKLWKALDTLAENYEWADILGELVELAAVEVEFRQRTERDTYVDVGAAAAHDAGERTEAMETAYDLLVTARDRLQEVER